MLAVMFIEGFCLQFLIGKAGLFYLSAINGAGDRSRLDLPAVYRHGTFGAGVYFEEMQLFKCTLKEKIR